MPTDPPWKPGMPFTEADAPAFFEALISRGYAPEEAQRIVNQNIEALRDDRLAAAEAERDALRELLRAFLDFTGQSGEAGRPVVRLNHQVGGLTILAARLRSYDAVVEAARRFFKCARISKSIAPEHVSAAAKAVIAELEDALAALDDALPSAAADER